MPPSDVLDRWCPVPTCGDASILNRGYIVKGFLKAHFYTFKGRISPLVKFIADLKDTKSQYILRKNCFNKYHHGSHFLSQSQTHYMNPLFEPVKEPLALTAV